MGRMIGRQLHGDDPAPADVMRTELTELKLGLVKVTHGALLITMRLLAGQTDVSLPVAVLGEKLGVGAGQSTTFPI